jgi:hypothetical protein
MMRRRFSGPAGVAIARRAGKRWLITVGNQRLRKNPPWRTAQLGALSRRPLLPQGTGVRRNQFGSFFVAWQSGAHAMDCSGLQKLRIVNQRSNA